MGFWSLGRGLGVSEGVRVLEGVGGLDNILQHCCGNSFSFKWSGRESGVQGVCPGGTLDNGL